MSAMISIVSLSSANTFYAESTTEVEFEITKNGEDFKHGQYVYVTLKDGSETAGKIVGKRNTKKYYVNQLDGSHHGVVHKKYIRKMTKEEVKNYVAGKGSASSNGNGF